MERASGEHPSTWEECLGSTVVHGKGVEGPPLEYRMGVEGATLVAPLHP